MALEGRNIYEVISGDRDGEVEGGMGSEEIVVSNKEDGSGDSAVKVIETVSRVNMMFESSIETFNELFEGSELSRDGIKVLKADNQFMSDWVVGWTSSVDKIDRFDISGIAVGNGGDILVGSGGADRFVDSDSSGEDIFRMVEMVSRAGAGMGRNKEEGIESFSQDFDISFVAGNEVIDGAFESQVKLMAEEGGDLRIV